MHRGAETAINYHPFGNNGTFYRNYLNFLIAKALRMHIRFGRPDDPPLTPDEARRVDYYIGVREGFDLQDAAPVLDMKATGSSQYKADLFRVLRHFPARSRYRVRLGDVTELQPEPTLVKSRPIGGANQNSVMIPLEAARHFLFVRDPQPFEAKRDGIVWRGAVYLQKRVNFMNATARLPFCDAAAVAQRPDLSYVLQPKMSIPDQLAFKFIFSIEGNDVATNLKWIMSSNSVCFMPPPEYETWFMEGTLVPGRHYVELAADYSDLEEKYRHYLARPELCREIMTHAHEYVRGFCDFRREMRIARAVVRRYLELSGQPF